MKHIQQLDLFSEQPEEQSEREPTPAPVPSTGAAQFSAAEIEAMKAKLLAWGQLHEYPGFAFPYMFPPRDEDEDRRFGLLWRGAQNWKRNIAHPNQVDRYPGEWLVKALAHVERYDRGIWRIPEQITTIADDRE